MTTQEKITRIKEIKRQINMYEYNTYGEYLELKDEMEKLDLGLSLQDYTNYTKESKKVL